MTDRDHTPLLVSSRSAGPTAGDATVDVPGEPAAPSGPPLAARSSPAPRAPAHPPPEPAVLLERAPLPERYGEDALSAVWRDPYTLFVAWEVTPQGRAQAARTAGELGRLVVRVEVDGASGAAQVIDHPLADEAGGIYLGAPAPGTRLAVRLGVAATRSAAFGDLAPAVALRVPWDAPAPPSEVTWVRVEEAPAATGAPDGQPAPTLPVVVPVPPPVSTGPWLPERPAAPPDFHWDWEEPEAPLGSSENAVPRRARRGPRPGLELDLGTFTGPAGASPGRRDP